VPPSYTGRTSQLHQTCLLATQRRGDCYRDLHYDKSVTIDTLFPFTYLRILTNGCIDTDQTCYETPCQHRHIQKVSISRAMYPLFLLLSLSRILASLESAKPKGLYNTKRQMQMPSAHGRKQLNGRGII